jgi:hypothetical protein
VTASPGHAPETLWEDGEFVQSRGAWDGEGLPLLAAMPSSAQPSPKTLARLQHAHALREELDPAWAARPLRLELHKGRLTLLNEDPGGEPLLRLTGRPWEITAFLRVEIGVRGCPGREQVTPGRRYAHELSRIVIDGRRRALASGAPHTHTRKHPPFAYMAICEPLR